MPVQNWSSLCGRVLALAGLLCWIVPPKPLWGQESPAPSPAPPSPPSTTPDAAAAVSPDEVVLAVGDVKITAAEFERITASLPPQFRGAIPSLGKAGFAEQFANLVALALEGEKRQLDQTEQFREMVEFDRRLLLAQVTMNELASQIGPVSPEEIGYYYESHQAEFEQVKVTSIYIPFQAPPAARGASPPAASQSSSQRPRLTEQQAQRKALELRARINAGENMAALARTESDHPTASKGGDFGFVGRGQLAPEITNAIFALQPKRVSAPVKDRFGFFLFRLEEKRVQPLEEVRQGIQNGLSMEKLNNHLQKVREAYPVTLNPKYFTAAPPAGQTTPGTPQP